MDYKMQKQLCYSHLPLKQKTSSLAPEARVIISFRGFILCTVDARLSQVQLCTVRLCSDLSVQTGPGLKLCCHLVALWQNLLATRTRAINKTFVTPGGSLLWLLVANLMNVSTKETERVYTDLSPRFVLVDRTSSLPCREC